MTNLAEISKKVEIRTFRLITPKGKYIYQSDKDGKPIYGKYNLLRHFGTTWYLARTKNIDFKPLKASIKWADEKLSFHKDQAFYVDKDTVKTGAVALALLAKLALYEYFNNNELKIQHIEALDNWLLANQMENGDFYHKFNMGKKGNLELDDFRSEYYTGEIIYALGRMQQLFPTKQRIKAICKALDYLRSINYGVKEQSHWMLYALEQAYKINHNTEYRAWAYEIVQDIMRNPNYQTRGATPIACRVEGMLAYARLKYHEEPSTSAYLAYSGYIKNDIIRMLDYYDNGFFYKDGISQIDYNQHCGSALRGYLELIEPAK